MRFENKINDYLLNISKEIMFSTSQKTINRPISCCGIGLHSGLKVNMTLLPAPIDSGITFIRTDIKDKNNQIRANYKNVTDTNLGTTIANEVGVKVSTIEHLMAAFWGYEIDNLIVELDSPEIPIMDGSSAPFIFLVECAGKCDQEVPRKIIEITKKVIVQDGDKYASLEPSKEFSISLDIDFSHSQLGCQNFKFHPRRTSFKNDISRARTFAFEIDIE
jgi:UDP-3-O-[3-hydroxymyristoyl] N-acetylglucosamine deacetylase